MPDVVFNPNHADQLDEFLHDCVDKKTNWTAKKRSQAGEIHLFYFGAPESRVVGIGVVSENLGRKKGKYGWTQRRSAYFCRFEPLMRLPQRADAAVLGANRLREWWATKPYRGSPKTIPDAAANQLLQLIAAHGSKIANLIEKVHQKSTPDPGGGDDVELGFPEGKQRRRYVLHRDRERRLRAAKISEALTNGGLACEVPGCSFDFEAFYGKLGRGFAHVHHKRPLSSLKKETFTKTSDLAIVCAKCHAMLHVGGKSRKVTDLKLRNNPRTARGR
jgi:hypothetical protein